MKRISVICIFSLLAVVIGLLLPASHNLHASEKVLLEIAVESPVDGWNVLADSSTYGSGDDIANIYDGGFETYTEAGVVDALRRLYTKGEEYVEVTVHTMRSSRSARDFLANRFDMETGNEAPTSSGWDDFTVSGAGSTTAYAVRGTYFITVLAYSEGEKGKAQTGAFIQSLDKKAAFVERKIP